jgi:hypothetical protein
MIFFNTNEIIQAMIEISSPILCLIYSRIASSVKFLILFRLALLVNQGDRDLFHSDLFSSRCSFLK